MSIAGLPRTAALECTMYAPHRRSTTIAPRAEPARQPQRQPIDPPIRQLDDRDGAIRGARLSRPRAPGAEPPRPVTSRGARIASRPYDRPPASSRLRPGGDRKAGDAASDFDRQVTQQVNDLKRQGKNADQIVKAVSELVQAKGTPLSWRTLASLMKDCA